MMYLKRYIGGILLVVMVAILSGCSDDVKYNELPSEIQEFVARYFPNTGIDTFKETSSVYHVKLKSSVGITFGLDYSWEAVSGYGATLPQVFLYDQLPPVLFNYLQETEQLNAVYAVERVPRLYTVTLFDNTLTYDTVNGAIHGYQ